DFLATEIPGLSEISKLAGRGPVTFLSLANLAAGPDPQRLKAAQRANMVLGLVKSAIETVDAINSAHEDGDGITINFATFYLTGMPKKTAVTDDSATARSDIPLLQNPRNGQPLRVFVRDVSGNKTELDRKEFEVVQERQTSSGVRTFVSRVRLKTARSGAIEVDYTTTEGGTLDLTDRKTPVRARQSLIGTGSDGVSKVKPAADGSIDDDVERQANAKAKDPSKARKALSTLKSLLRQPDGSGIGGYGIHLPLFSQPVNLMK